MRTLPIALVLIPSFAYADPPLEYHVGGYLQPQLRVRQNSAAPGDEDGLRVRRARVTAAAKTTTHDVDISANLELELVPQPALLDGYITAQAKLPSDGSWRVDVGQVKAPFSRQDLLSDAVLGFVEKPEIASLAPDRQIGIRGAVEIPALPMVQLWGGVFDGEGTNQLQNLDEKYMYVGRVEVHPLGRGAKLQESAFVDQITIGANVMQNTRVTDSATGATENDFEWGADVSAAYRGVYATFEYLQLDHRFPFVINSMTGMREQAGTPYHGNGFVAEATYLLPLPDCWANTLELGGRVEEIDRDDTHPVTTAGEANQSLRYYTGVLSYYHSKSHDMKAQLTYSHIVEVEDKSRTGADITFPNDTLLAQITLRME